MALSSDDLVWHLVEEASTIKLEASVNKAHAALAAAHGRAGKGPSADGSKGKDKRGKDRKSATPCPNCKVKGHTRENCFSKGGGKEHEAPEWWKLKQAAKAKDPKKESASVAAESSSKSENHAYVAWGPKNFDPPTDEAIPALVVTSGHNHEAFGVSQLTDLIIDCGASSHFSPDKSKLVNFKSIPPESI
jgi:hypothetical protein